MVVWAVVRLVPLAEPLFGGVAPFAEVVRGGFCAGRKTLRNALGLAAEELQALGIDPRLRPENLSPADYVRIARRTISTLC
jgi:16S rRNA (adenine1518-N6/adenine1519-N6)-dimethyltransferase